MNIICYKFNDEKVISIELKNADVTETSDFNGFSLLFNNDELIGINISNQLLTNKYDCGLIYCDDDFIKEVNYLTKIDISNYKQCLILCSKIIDLEHIDGTHLNYCDVKISDDETIKLICGASNARKDLITVCATDGVILPSGNRIVASKVMNKQSNGMLCSYKELNILNKESSGIIELNENDLYSVFKPAYVNLKEQ